MQENEHTPGNVFQATNITSKWSKQSANKSPRLLKTFIDFFYDHIPLSTALSISEIIYYLSLTFLEVCGKG